MPENRPPENRPPSANDLIGAVIKAIEDELLTGIVGMSIARKMALQNAHMNAYQAMWWITAARNHALMSGS